MESDVTVREIDHASPEYEAVCRARDRILRQPLGLRLSEADRRGETVQRHFILEADGRLLGGVIARARARRVVQLRQMWIEADRAGEGLGRRLLEEVARRIEAEGIERLMLHARRPVLGFYRKCGFRAEGLEFTEIGIPHRKMSRRLNRERRSPGGRR